MAVEKRARVALYVVLLSCAVLVAEGVQLSLMRGLETSEDSAVGAQMRTDMKYLSDMTLQGRAPGTKGEQLAAEYIVGELRKIKGVVPAGDNETFYSKVPLVGMTIDESGHKCQLNVGSSDLKFLDDFVTSTDLRQQNDAELSLDVSFDEAEVVFVGHGIHAPELKWNDYKGLNATGKVLLMFTNEPKSISPPGEMTYYGRWSYKYEIGRKLGARGVLLIHTNETAGYPYSVVQSSNSGEQVSLDKEVEGVPLAIRGWVSEAVGSKLASLYDASVEQWMLMASQPDFKPIVLEGARLSHSARYTQRRFAGVSVLGVLPGTAGSERASELVVHTGHLDHLGVRNGKVYPGAVDNACGAGMTLALARMYSKLYQSGMAPEATVPRRSVLFFFPTAEEAGLYGSEYYASHPKYPLEKTVAALNFDIGNVWGKSRDFVILGGNKSDLGTVTKRAAAALGMSISPDPTPAAGMFYRSDHLNFARKGVPGVWIATGTKFVGRPDSYYDQTVGEYIRSVYHQPSDLYSPSFDMAGLEQQVMLAYTVGKHLAESDSFLRCYNPNGTCL